MIHFTRNGEMKIYWKSVRRKHPDRSKYRAVSAKLRKKCREYNLKHIGHLRTEREHIAREKPKNKIKKPRNSVLSLAAILEDFIAVEKNKLDEYDLKHAPSIGNMYEGLTGSIVDKIIPSKLDLRVVTGFIIDNMGYMSGQIDRMLVQGEGEEVPHSGGQYKYHIKDVLVIFEVKKHLRNQDFKDAYEHLRKITFAYSEYFERLLEGGYEPDIKHVAKLFSQITSRPEPTKYSDIFGMDKEDAIIFYTLVQSVFSPVTLIHGYGGYKTEAGLRKAFINFLESKVKEPGFGAPSLPNLVSSEAFSMVKLAGMPFMSPREDDGNWPLVASSRDNVAQLIIEIIWTKISVYCDISMPWGDDLGTEALSLLFSGRYKSDIPSGKEGWFYSFNDISEADMQNERSEGVWEPTKVTKVVRDAFQHMGIFGCLDLNSEIGVDFIKESKLDKAAFKEAILKTHLCSINGSDQIAIVGEAVHIVEVGDDEFALSNDNNRLTAWCNINSIRHVPISLINMDKI